MPRGLLVAITLLLVTPLFAVATIVLGLLSPLGIVRWAIRGWGRTILRAAGVRVHVEGGARAHATRPAVVASNHASAIDIYLLCGHFPWPFGIAAKRQLFRIPLFGWALRATGGIPIERTGTRRDIERLDQAARRFSRGVHMVFYAEGTRSRDGRLQPFKKGAFATAIRHGVPVIPVAIVGTHLVQPAKSFRVRAGEVTLRFLEPVPTAGLGPGDRDRLVEEVRRRIAAALPADQLPAADPDPSVARPDRANPEVAN